MCNIGPGFQRVQRSSYNTTTISDATADEAKYAFLRICRVGVPMSEADFDQAVAWHPKAPAP
jgi:hypothetical protein